MRTQEVVRALRARRCVNRSHGVSRWRAVGAGEQPRLLEVCEEHPERPDRPAHGGRLRRLAVTGSKLRFPVDQEELEVGRGQISNSARPEPIDEGAQ